MRRGEIVRGDDAQMSPFRFRVLSSPLRLMTSVQQVWGDGCFFAPFGLPGSKLEGIKAAFVDLLVSRCRLLWCFVSHTAAIVTVAAAAIARLRHTFLIFTLPVLPLDTVQLSIGREQLATEWKTTNLKQIKKKRRHSVRHNWPQPPLHPMLFFPQGRHVGSA